MFKVNIIALFLLPLVISSCGDKQDQVNLPNPMDEAVRYARSVYGENVNLTLKGDLNVNGKTDALAIVINKQISDLKFWIKEGGVIEKEKDGWKVILSFGSRLMSTRGPLVEQVEANHGYIVEFLMVQNPIEFRVAVSNNLGQPVSSEGTIRWNREKESYEYTSGNVTP